MSMHQSHSAHNTCTENDNKTNVHEASAAIIVLSCPPTPPLPHTHVVTKIAGTRRGANRGVCGGGVLTKTTDYSFGGDRLSNQEKK